MKCNCKCCGKRFLVGEKIFLVMNPDDGLNYQFCSAECIGKYFTQWSIELTEELKKKLNKAKSQSDISEILENA